MRVIPPGKSLRKRSLLIQKRPQKSRDNNTKPHTYMNTLEIKGDWNIAKGKLRQKWAKLTDDDLQYVRGKEEELVGRIQKRTGETREVVEKALRDDCGCRN
jgi:uncharacterized protein YjbJ (UPF0337 family)